jgi:hypothetical protein
MISDNAHHIIKASGLLSASNIEEWGQPSAGNYVFIVIDKVMYGQITGSNYLSTYQIKDTLPTENLVYEAIESKSWLAVAESAFDFWDNEQDAFFDNL